MRLCLEELKRCKEGAANVLIHCSGGLSRSVTMILAWLMSEYDMTLAAAVAMTTTARGRQLQCNPSFWSSLIRFERELRSNPLLSPTFDVMPWIIEDFHKLGFDERKIQDAITNTNFDADAALELLLNGGAIEVEEKKMV